MVESTYKLDPRLAADTVSIGEWPLCEVLLMNDSQFPWLILVPKLAGIRELSELSEDQSLQLLAESRLCQKVMMELFSPYKMNVAALGNVVEQLHIHHIARQQNDVAWPAPVWGRQPVQPYDADTLKTRCEQLRLALEKQGDSITFIRKSA